ncbi:MAG TPA: ABC transporter ATP-binding protein [Gaiellaceae bacterium]|nr:ABC transporter ATP-binding protein [Gaiellaceae bacterium]
MSVLEVRGLRIEAPQGVIVDGLDLTVGEGETIGIVGESGSGKSLTARALVGLLPAGLRATGSVTFRGRELLGARERAWREVRGTEIALLLQDPFTMLNPLMRVGRQIDETAPARGQAAARLAEVGIREAHVADRYPFQLSGGMRQRVGLASALASDPTVLVADEPSTALDVTTQREILRLIRSTQEARGMSVVLITHDLRVAFSVCDRVYVLYAGQLLEVGTAAELEHHPSHPYTHALLAAEPLLEHRLERLPAIPGAVPRAEAVRGHCAFAGRCRFTADACRTARPPLRQIATGQVTACLRYDEIASSLVPAVRVSSVRSDERAPADALLRVDGVSKSFGGARPALDGVSLAVGRGEKVGLVGESGSGKTTLARCLLGLETPGAGRIELEGLDVSDYATLSTAERRRARHTVQIVFQDPYSTLNPARSVGFTIGEAIRRARVRGGGAPIVAELLDLVGLPAAYSVRRPSALSGGERQRVAIARALALQPSLLVCDEPVSALDVSVQAQILNLLLDLNEQIGLACLFITHDLAVVRQVSERVYVMHEGRIVEAGATADVLAAPREEYTRTLIDSVPQSDPAWLAPANI